MCSLLVCAYCYVAFSHIFLVKLYDLQIPVIVIDSLAYGRLSIVPWNIVKYNVFGGSARGPDLYGTEPWYWYILNLVINFNVVAPLALLSLPALVITYFVDNKRVGGPLRSSSAAEKEKDKELGERSSPFALLTIRLLPFYLWLGILTAQAHKEERFFFPAYPFLLFNAATTLYLIRGWLESAYVSVTRSPYRASSTSIFSQATRAVTLFAAVISVSRILAWSYYFHAPLSVIHAFETKELPRVLNVTGLLPPPPPIPLNAPSSDPRDNVPRIDLGPVKLLNLTLCVGKEWYRFPSHFLVPDGVNVEFVKSEFNGLLPRHFVPTVNGTIVSRDKGTRFTAHDLNDLNKEEKSHYVSILFIYLSIFLVRMKSISD